MIATILVISIFSAAIAFVLPPVFRSTATILIEQQEIPQDLVRSTVTSFADQRIQVISQRVMTRANLMQIIKKYDLYVEEQKKEPTEVIIDKMRDDIKMNTISADVVDPRNGRPTQATIAFTLSFDSKSPKLAQQVTNELVSLYLNENLKSRTQMAVETSGFLTEEVNRVNKKILELEKALAVFKKKNYGKLPDMIEINMKLMDKTEQELMEGEREVRSLKERKIYLESQLAQMDPNSKLFSENGQRILSPADKYKELQTKYLKFSAIYGSGHPDVVRLKKELAALKTEVMDNDTSSDLAQQLKMLNTELVTAREKYSNDHPKVKQLEKQISNIQQALNKSGSTQVVEDLPEQNPDNPAYIQLQAQLESAESDLRSYLKKHEQLSEKLAMLENRITDTPHVEREYHALMRDYDNAWAKYKELKAKQMEAKLAESLEVERKGERFTLIEPPELPEKPLKPNRTAILLLGFVFSLAGGVGTVALKETTDESIRGRKGVMTIVDVPPLGDIPYIEIEEDKRKKRRRIMLLIAGVLVGVLTTLVLFHLFVKPLDVLWFVLLKKFGFN